VLNVPINEENGLLKPKEPRDGEPNTAVEEAEAAAAPPTEGGLAKGGSCRKGWPNKTAGDEGVDGIAAGAAAHELEAKILLEDAAGNV